MFTCPTEYVGKTFAPNSNEEPDMYLIGKEKKDHIGIDETDYEFAKSRWCFDTPGVMHPDQVCLMFKFLLIFFSCYVEDNN